MYFLFRYFLINLSCKRNLEINQLILSYLKILWFLGRLFYKNYGKSNEELGHVHILINTFSFFRKEF